jgi:UDP-N-acetylglucosamine 4,6-dehydratase
MVSRGSVIPLFVSQIKAGKPLTITDPNMTRFLMSLDDSVDLVLHAYGHGQQGDIFVQKAPAATIGDLVQALKELFNADNPVQIVGTRHGEKLYESLVSREEMARSRTCSNIIASPPTTGISTTPCISPRARRKYRRSTTTPRTIPSV